MGRRGSGEGSIYRRKDGRWVGQIELRSEGGKRNRKFIYGSTRSEVAKRLSTLLADLDRGIRPPNDKLLLGDFLSEWLETVVKDQVRPSTVRSYTDIVNQHLRPDLGDIPISSLRPQDIASLLASKSSSLSPRTVQYIHAVLRRALNFAVRWDVVPRNVATLVDPPRAPRVPQSPLSLLQAKALLAEASNHRLYALYAVAISMGLRRGEALALSWDDIDFGAGTLVVNKSLQRIDGALLFVEPKTERANRTLQLPDFCISALRAHRVRLHQERLVKGSRWRDHNLVFPSTVGTPMEPRNLTRQFHEMCARASIPRRRFHDLRHTCATLMLAQGVPARVVMEVLGHSDFGTTMNIYSHVMPVLLDDAAAQMSELLGS